MNKDILEKLTRARTGLILDFPFFGQLALRLRLVERADISTLAVNGRQIFYNPDFVNELSADLTKSAIAHEVMHCVYDHITRRGDRNAKKFNIAGDFVINLMLKDSGFNIGKGWLLDPQYAGMSTDQVYALLPESQDDDSESGGMGQDVQKGESESTEADAADWKIATIQAATSARMQGKLPGSLNRFIEELTTPKVDWRDRLRRFVTEVNKEDYSWTRPNRRFQAQGIFLPSLYSESMGAIVVAIDTSGSIDQATLNAFGSEIKSIVQSTRPSSTTVIYCDSSVNHVDTFSMHDELKFDMHGGGGTAFEPPFDYVAEHDLKPVCFVYLTDMYGSFPAAPDYPVMWCATSDVEGPFGETIPIDV